MLAAGELVGEVGRGGYWGEERIVERTACCGTAETD